MFIDERSEEQKLKVKREEDNIRSKYHATKILQTESDNKWRLFKKDEAIEGDIMNKFINKHDRV